MSIYDDSWWRQFEELARRRRQLEEELQLRHLHDILRQHDEYIESAQRSIDTVKEIYEEQHRLSQELANISNIELYSILNQARSDRNVSLDQSELLRTVGHYWADFHNYVASQGRYAILYSQVLEASTVALKSNAAAGLLTDLEPYAFASALLAELKKTEIDSTDEATAFVLFSYEVANRVAPRASPSQLAKVMKVIWTIMLVLGPVFLAKAISDEKSAAEDRKRLIEIVDQSRQPPLRFPMRDLNVREIPGRDGKSIGRIPSGLAVEELDRSANGWRYVRTFDGSIEGWVSERYLRSKPPE